MSEMRRQIFWQSLAQEVIDLIPELVDYFDERADLNNEGGPNEEMRLKQECDRLWDMHKELEDME